MLTINETSTPGVMVPTRKANLFLKIALKYPAMNQGKLIIHDENIECASVLIKGFDTVQGNIPIRTINRDVAERIMKLRVEFIPMLRNRAPAPQRQRLKIESITLTSKSKDHGRLSNSQYGLGGNISQL